MRRKEMLWQSTKEIFSGLRRIVSTIGLEISKSNGKLQYTSEAICKTVCVHKPAKLRIHVNNNDIQIEHDSIYYWFGTTVTEVAASACTT